MKKQWTGKGRRVPAYCRLCIRLPIHKYWRTSHLRCSNFSVVHPSSFLQTALTQPFSNFCYKVYPIMLAWTWLVKILYKQVRARVGWLYLCMYVHICVCTQAFVHFNQFHQYVSTFAPTTYFEHLHPLCLFSLVCPVGTYSLKIFTYSAHMHYCRYTPRHVLLSLTGSVFFIVWVSWLSSLQRRTNTSPSAPPTYIHPLIVFWEKKVFFFSVFLFCIPTTMTWVRRRWIHNYIKGNVEPDFDLGAFLGLHGIGLALNFLLPHRF